VKCKLAATLLSAFNGNVFFGTIYGLFWELRKAGRMIPPGGERVSISAIPSILMTKDFQKPEIVKALLRARSSGAGGSEDLIKKRRR
jgi:hypothetical protein